MSYRTPLPSREEALASGLPFYARMESLDENGAVCTADREVATWIAAMRTAYDSVELERIIPLGESYYEHRKAVEDVRQEVADFITSVDIQDLAEEPSLF